VNESISSLATSATEGRNPASEQIDALSTLEIVQLMNDEDVRVAEAVAMELPAIAAAIDIITARLQRGGRLIYCGAGTSGRLGVLDATECPPTFNTDPGLVVGLIAGGPSALTRAVEGAEDHAEYAIHDLQQMPLRPEDAVVAIATSGRTPYAIGALDYARQIGAAAIGLSCNRPSAMDDHAELMICPVVGPEVISGSTRLKAGTATKMVLNMLTTGTMVRLGKTYGNLMVDLRATNTKLQARSRRIVATITGLADADADAALSRCGGEVKTAVVSVLRQVTPDVARQYLAAAQGQLRRALSEEL
jgi:N-acetylmuramic acid 6-phosphate etherase